MTVTSVHPRETSSSARLVPTMPAPIITTRVADGGAAVDPIVNWNSLPQVVRGGDKVDSLAIKQTNLD